jgi:predicted nucleic acid-binding protein
MSSSAVVDTNLVFSALLPKASKIRDVLLDDKFTFYAPNFLVSELYRHKEKLISYSKLEESEFYLFFNGIMEKIQFISIDFISTESRVMAYNLCKDVDMKDIPFISLAIELKIPIWSGDKKLKKGLTEKGFNNYFVQ